MALRNDPEYFRAYRRAHADKIRQQHQEWNRNNREVCRRNARAWRERNPQRVRELRRAGYFRRRFKALIHQAAKRLQEGGGPVTTSVLSSCPVCGKKACLVAAGTGFLGVCKDPDCKLGANNLQTAPADTPELAGLAWNTMVAEMRKTMGLPEEEATPPAPRPKARKDKPTKAEPPPEPKDPEEDETDDDEPDDEVEVVEALRVNGTTLHLEHGEGCERCVFLATFHGLKLCLARADERLSRAVELCTATDGQWRE